CQNIQKRGGPFPAQGVNRSFRGNDPLGEGVDHAEQDELSQWPRERDGDALPTFAQVAATDGQSPKAIQHDVAVAPEDSAHDHMAHLMDQDRKEDAGDPQGEREETNLSEPGLPTKKRGDDPEHGVDAHGYAEEVKAQVIRRAIWFEQEHAAALWQG